MNNTRIKIQIHLFCLAVLFEAITALAQPVTMIAAGSYDSFFLKGDGSLWAMGDNYWGELGDNAPLQGYGYGGTNRPEQIMLTNVTAIAAGGNHTLFLKHDGSLWTTGDNEYGQLGIGTFTPDIPTGTNQPQQILTNNVKAIAAGAIHSLFLMNDGSLWAMGYNGEGELGDNTYQNTNRPEQIVSSNVTAIAAGGFHSLFLKSDGSLWAMGENTYGQLGDGTYNNTNQPEQIVSSNVTTIAAGDYHSLFLKSDGSLWAMGGNTCGQLGDGTDNNTNRPEIIVTNAVAAIAAGGVHSLFLKSDGSLWAMGYNESGDLGDKTYQNTNRPEQIMANNVTAIAAGEDHSLFLKSDGSLWAMGYDGSGELGDGIYALPYNTNCPEQIVAGPPGYNLIASQLLNGGNVRLSFAGIAGLNYALEISTSLSPANWIPLSTNSTDISGSLVLTNTPDAATNIFWRIRSVP
jgi:alpha-tubulin suppressor-like RCC1 family protein